MVEEAIRQRAQVNPIGAEDNGVETCVVVEDKVALGEDVMKTVDQEEGILVVVEEEDLLVLILWLVTGVGCVAIWPVPVPAPVHSR